MTDPSHLYGQLIEAFNQRRWPLAQGLAARLLPMAPNHGGVCYIAGVACLEMQQMPQALGLLHKAAELEPLRADIATQFAKALALVHRWPDATAAADRAMELVVDDPLSLDTLGVVYTQAHRHESAVSAFRRAVELLPEKAIYRFNLATALVAVGDLDEAERELETCIELDSTCWKAHLTLSQLRKQTGQCNHVDRLQRLVSQHANNEEAQTSLNMALAKEYEDLGEYPRAFESFVRGKVSGKEARNYDIKRDEALFDALIRAFPEPSAASVGDPTDEPIFIIGMPRSGTTLVERIISSHPDVYSAGELQNFGVVLKRLSGSRTPILLDQDTVERGKQIELKQLGADYLASTRPATGNKQHFIDKLPQNFLYAGFIANALPNAKIICLRRDPVDTCLSNFRQLFAQFAPLYGYSFDLLDIGRYFVKFDQLITHWQRVLPGRILEVHYEELVQSQEEQSRQLLAFCGLPWDERCLQYERNEAPVNTASAVQVRAPIYRSAVKRWKKYEAQLEPLLHLLTEAGVRFDR